MHNSRELQRIGHQRASTKHQRTPQPSSSLCSLGSNVGAQVQKDAGPVCFHESAWHIYWRLTRSLSTDQNFIKDTLGGVSSIRYATILS
jgi:hypothetical protein